MPKELTRKQKLKKYGAPSEVVVASIILVYPGEEYDPVELMEKIEYEVAQYPEHPSKRIILDRQDDYYDIYHNLTLIISRPLTTEEEDKIITSGDKRRSKRKKVVKCAS